MFEPIPYKFDKLPSYTRQEAELWNWYCRVFPSRQDWKSWCAEVFHELLERPAGQELCLVQSHSLQPAEGEKERCFVKEEVRIGRDPDNDVVLPLNSASKRHARIVLREGLFFLEDVGSALGTYKNKKKLNPNQAIVLNQGDQFAIFPYNFTVKFRQAWVPEGGVDVYPGEILLMDWSTFLKGTDVGRTSFAVSLAPTGGAACLQVNQIFLEQLLNRLLHPLGIQSARPGIVPSDSGLFELILVSLLERANRHLAFPFQFELSTPGEVPKLDPRGSGLALSFSVGLSQLVGTFRLFLPFSLLTAMQKVSQTLLAVSLPSQITWKFLVSAGNVELSNEELTLLEPNDIVLFNASGEILIPKHYTCGWSGSLIADAPWKFKIEKYFERSFFMQAGEYAKQDEEAVKARGTVPDLTQLPLLLHVVLSEKELTLAEANGLVGGTILELNKSRSDPVDLAINGKLVGKGELVEVEGKLGVKILSWSAA